MSISLQGEGFQIVQTHTGCVLRPTEGCLVWKSKTSLPPEPNLGRSIKATQHKLQNRDTHSSTPNPETDWPLQGSRYKPHKPQKTRPHSRDAPKAQKSRERSAYSNNLCMAGAKAIQRELRDLVEKPCEGIRVSLNDDSLKEALAELDGPDGTPYQGGTFKLRLSLGDEYPDKAPKGWFLTKIFHPNVSKSGEVCVNVLQKDWKASLGLRHVLLVIRCLLIQPFAESALNDEAGKLLLEDYGEYAKRAALMTSIHAVPMVFKRPMPQENCAGSLNLDSRVETAPAEVGGSPVHKKLKGECIQAVAKPGGVRRGLRRL